MLDFGGICKKRCLGKRSSFTLISFRESLASFYCPSMVEYLKLHNSTRRVLLKYYNIIQEESIIAPGISLSEKCLPFTDTCFTTMHLYTNMKPNLSNVVIFILIEQNESYVIR